MTTPEDASHVRLKEFIEAIIEEHDVYWRDLMDERDKRYEQRFTAQSEAIRKAEDAVNARFAAVDARFHSVNEFRGSLSDQQKTLITRTEVEQIIKSVQEQNLERLHALEGRADSNRALATTSMPRGEAENMIKGVGEKADERLINVQAKLDTLNALLGSTMPRGEAEQRITENSKKVEDLARQMLPRGEYEAAHKDLIHKVERLDENDRLRTGRSSGFESTRVLIFAVIGALVAIVGIALALYSAAGR